MLDEEKPENFTEDAGSSNTFLADNCIDSSSCSPSEDAYLHEGDVVGGRLNIKGSGVVNVEIYRRQYSRPLYRAMLFFSIYLVAFACGLDTLIRFTFQYQATSDYEDHSLLKTVNCVKTVMGAAGQLWYARASDIFGRNTMMIIALMFYIVGTIIESQADSIQKFAAGTCLHQLGLTGIQLLLEVIAMDFSNLNWRLLASFIPALPFVINIWISGYITQAVGDRWQWGIGMWAFILPLSCIPLAFCSMHMRFLAIKNERDKLQNEFKMYKELTWREYIVDIFFWRLDFLGLLLVCAVFGCVLIPLTIAGGFRNQWGFARMIVPEVLGWVVALPLFMVWEEKIAKHPLVTWDMIKDRGILAALIIAFYINFNWYMQGDYMFSVLLIAFNKSVLAASRIVSLYSFVSVITGTLLGFLIVKVRRTKIFILFGICCWFLSFGLLIHFIGGSGGSSGIIGSLCLLGFGSGLFTFTTQASIQASSKSHGRMAVVTALYLSIYSIGTAMGSAVSGAIWTHLLPKEIFKVMDRNLAEQAYGSPLIFIMNYDWGTAARQGLVTAYRSVQRTLCVVGLCFCVPLLIAALFLRNHKLVDSVSLEHIDTDQLSYEEKKADFVHKIKSYFVNQIAELPR